MIADGNNIPQAKKQVKHTAQITGGPKAIWYNRCASITGARLDSPLSRILVSLDLETTGLDSYRDAIIEIGAVKFRGDEILDTFSTFVNPGRAIPPKIIDLTGITDQDVNSAPSLFSVTPRLVSFV